MLLLLLSVNHAHLNQLFITVQHFQVQHLNNVKPFSGSSLRPWAYRWFLIHICRERLKAALKS